MSAIREGDVFRFRYSAERAPKHMPYHCFDGQLIAFKQPDGSLLLRDTYWLYAHPDFKERSDTRSFTEDDARERGELEFVCNLGDVERVEKDRTLYYDDGDVFDLSHQHRCYPYFAIRKGAERCPEKMRREIASKIQDAERRINSAKWEIERMHGYAAKVDAGQLDEVYL